MGRLHRIGTLPTSGATCCWQASLRRRPGSRAGS